MEGERMNQTLSRRLSKSLSGYYDPRERMPKSEDSEPGSGQRRSAREISGEFAEMTSMQGVNYIHFSRKLWLKLLWLVIVLSACGAMIFHLYYLCNVYFNWPKQTKIILGFDSLTFPAVTVCNINPIRASMLKDSGVLMERLMQNTNTTNQIWLLNHTETEGVTSPPQEGEPTVPTLPPTTPKLPPEGARSRRKRYLDDLSVNYTNAYANYTDNLDGVDDQWAKVAPRTTESRIEQEFEALYSAMPRNQRLAIGHQLKEFMVQSSFAGRTIKNDNFKVHQSMIYGNCFTLQYSDFISRKSGPTEGLEIVLFLENDEYLRGWTNGNGAHLVIHDLNTVPLIEQDGIAIAGGSETFIGIKRVNIERLGIPYGTCDLGTDYWSKYNVTYTRQVCQDFCQVRLFVEKCNCFDNRHEETNMIFKLKENSHPCKSQSEIKCVIQVERDYEFGKYASTCSCPNPCKETKFEKSISSRQWPSVEYGNVLVEAICARSGRSQCQKLREYDGFRLSQNFIKLNIFYEDLNYENVTEEADYEDAQFLSDIGGTLGLWIGLSVISLFEICQFFVELIGVCCKCDTEEDDRKRNGRVRNSQTAPERLHTLSSQKAQNDHGDYGLNQRHVLRN